MAIYFKLKYNIKKKTLNETLCLNEITKILPKDLGLKIFKTINTYIYKKITIIPNCLYL